MRHWNLNIKASTTLARQSYYTEFMMYQLSHKGGPLSGCIELTSSKSISNRALIIQSLAKGSGKLNRLATADDTKRLEKLLNSNDAVLDAGPAGTTYRFLTARLCLRPGTQQLTGSERMKERPIGILVDALRSLGADITYLEKEGYPPLSIADTKLDKTNELTIDAGTSSQFISALLLLAPVLPNGLKLTLEGEIVSLPYIKMTLSMMAHFGVAHSWEGQTIIVAPQAYVGKDFTVEADWSAASYYYSLAAIAPAARIEIKGLFQKSVQGDAVLPDMYKKFGVETTFNQDGITITKAENATTPPMFEYDFLECPDLAQTVFISCAALGTKGLFTGLKTLKIKETDRLKAVKTELLKVQAYLSELPARFSPTQGRGYVMLDGKVTLPATPPTFATYHDHRMAMALAPLSLLGKINIEDPMVIVKSYPEFYEDLAELGVQVDKMEH